MKSIAQHFLGLREILNHDKLTDAQAATIDADILHLVGNAATDLSAGFVFRDGSKLTTHPDGWEATGPAEDFKARVLHPLIEELKQFADGQGDYIEDLCLRAAEGLEGRLRIELTDAMFPEDEEKVPCRITVDPSGIYIRPEGYGDFCAADGEGCPVMVEFYNGEMRVVVWGDINHDDTTHIISLEGAKEDVREEDDDNDNDASGRDD